VSINPFTFSGASNLTDDQILDTFVHDYNHSRFIQSKRNVFLWGERGSGKTMMLLYNKLKMQRCLIGPDHVEMDVAYFPVYVSCITPVMSKREYLLLEDDFREAVISEHFLVLTVSLSLVSALLAVPDLINADYLEHIEEDINYLIDDVLEGNRNVFEKLQNHLTREFTRSQKIINSPSSNSFYENTLGFSSFIIPLVRIVNKYSRFKKTHTIFMMDDAHDLNHYQRAILNGWIAYRDNSLFSFKISAARSTDYDHCTLSGGAILQGHDYVAIDMEQSFQNTEANFSKLASHIIQKRLALAGITTEPEDFFPEDPTMCADIANCKEIATKQAKEKYTSSETKKIADYVYKYTRAIYFRTRHSKANKPKYSGLETITHLSTGVIRNLLEPCFEMYDEMASTSTEKSSPVNKITTRVQTDVITNRSKKYWEDLKDGVDRDISDCTKEQADMVYNLFTNLLTLMRVRLLDESCSEPRAVKFSISAPQEELMTQINPILDIARKAQLLYRRLGSDKDAGNQIFYYTPNRMLLVARGLDPIGQHATISIQAKYILGAMGGKEIPYKEKPTNQMSMFNE
jgi:hypothetical protein